MPKRNPVLPEKQRRCFLAVAISTALANSDALFVADICNMIRSATENRFSFSSDDVFDFLYQNVDALERDRSGRWCLTGPLKLDGLYIWQQGALNVWRSNQRRGIVEAVTGTGKTRVALEAAREHLANGGRVAIIVPTIELMEQWAREIERHLGVPCGRCGGTYNSRIDLRPVTLFVAASAGKHLPAQMQRCPEIADSLLLIADECHRYGTDILGSALNKPFASTLGITATLQRAYDDGVQRYIVPGLGPLIYSYGYEAAINDKVIPKFFVALVKLDFSEFEQIEYDRLSTKIADTYSSLRYKYPDLDDTPFFFSLLKSKADAGDAAALAWLSLIQKRRQVLIEATARRQFVTWLTSQNVWHRNVVLFHENIEQCKNLSADLNRAGIAASAHHSELDKSERRAVLADFRSGLLKAIVAPRTLDEGIDVPDASLGILVARTAVERQSIQRAGRILRRAKPDKVPQIVVLCIDGSKDDPDAQGDEFIGAIRDLGLLRDFYWPHDAAVVAEWLQLDEPAAMGVLA